MELDFDDDDEEDEEDDDEDEFEDDDEDEEDLLLLLLLLLIDGDRFRFTSSVSFRSSRFFSSSVRELTSFEVAEATGAGAGAADDSKGASNLLLRLFGPLESGTVSGA